MDIRFRTWGQYYQVRRGLLQTAAALGRKMAEEGITPGYKRWLENSRRTVYGVINARPVDVGGRGGLRGPVIQVRGLLDKQAGLAAQKDLFPEPAEAQAGFGVGFPVLNLHTLQAAIAHPYTELAAKLPARLMAKISTTITTGVATGKPTEQIARDLVKDGLPRGTYDTRLERARVVAADSVAKITVGGNLDAYESEDVLTGVVTGRPSTCPKCGPLVGKEFPIAVLRTLIPAHPHCVHGVAAASRRGADGKVVRI